MFLIRNIKVSVKVKALILNNALSCLKKRDILPKEYCNFIIFKSNNFTFILFKRKQLEDTHVNITQIPDVVSINKAVKCLINLINCEVNYYTVDNIIATSDLKKPIDLTQVLNSNTFERVKYNNEVFPGLFIKFNQGTLILFHTGKIVIVGCKSIDSIQWILNAIHAIK